MSEDEFKNLTKQNCYYCGIEPLQKGARIAGINGYYYHNGIDRTDNNRGYVLDNCVACCSMCNNAKNSYSLKEFMIWIDRITKFQGEKNES